jgi:hypothetical protein
VGRMDLVRMCRGFEMFLVMVVVVHDALFG